MHEIGDVWSAEKGFLVGNCLSLTAVTVQRSSAINSQAIKLLRFERRRRDTGWKIVVIVSFNPERKLVLAFTPAYKNRCSNPE